MISRGRGDFQTAVDYLTRAGAAAPKDPQIAANLAHALLDQGRSDAALGALEAFLLRNPGQIDALIARAIVLQRAGRLEDAVAAAQLAVAFNRGSAQAQLTLGTALIKVRRADDATLPLTRATEIEPTLVDAWVNLGVAQRDIGRLSEAESTYRQALALAPDDAVIHNNRANVLAGLGRKDEARDGYRAALAIRPDYIDARVNLANMVREEGDATGALAILNEAGTSDHPGLLNARGNALRAAERYDEAIEVLTRAVAAAPDNAEAANNLGLALAVKNQIGAAEPYFRRAAELRPDNAVISNNHGALLLRLFRFDDAIKALANAVARDPKYEEAMCNLGVAHYMLGQANEAIAIYRRIIAGNPDNGFARYGLAVTLLEDQRLAEAEAEVRRVIATDPGNAMAHNTLGVLLLDQHHISDARAAMKAAAEVNTLSAPIFYSNYAFAGLYEPGLTRDEIFNVHRAFGARYASNQPDLAHRHANVRDPDRKLVLAYVSPDFRGHSVAYFFEALLEKHDRSQFEVVLYSNTTRKDTVTDAFRKAADRWVETVGLTDEAFVERMREDKIDVVIDLGGHTSGNRLPALAKGAAPIQASYLGYADTAAVPAVKYRIIDARSDPPGDADRYATETLVRLPDCFHCYRPHGKAPPPAGPPHVTKGYVTYASFNVLPKVNDGTIAAWSAILHAVPNARFYIKCKQLRDAAVRGRIHDAFAKHGIDPARIGMESFVPSVQDHLNQYALVDLALDTFPYNGTTTTCEALWMGVPVLTIAGERHSSRVGLSLLTAVGLADEFVARNVDDYIARAIALGKNPGRLAEIRPQLRPMMAASPLRDEVKFTRNLESAYRKLWKEWCAGPQTYEFLPPPELRPEDSIQGVLVKTL